MEAQLQALESQLAEAYRKKRVIAIYNEIRILMMVILAIILVVLALSIITSQPNKARVFMGMLLIVVFLFVPLSMLNDLFVTVFIFLILSTYMIAVFYWSTMQMYDFIATMGVVMRVPWNDGPCTRSYCIGWKKNVFIGYYFTLLINLGIVTYAVFLIGRLFYLSKETHVNIQLDYSKWGAQASTLFSSSVSSSSVISLLFPNKKNKNKKI